MVNLLALGCKQRRRYQPPAICTRLLRRNVVIEVEGQLLVATGGKGVGAQHSGDVSATVVRQTWRSLRETPRAAV